VTNSATSDSVQSSVEGIRVVSLADRLQCRVLRRQGVKVYPPYILSTS